MERSGVGRVFGLLAASIDGKLGEVSEGERLARIGDLRSMAESVPAEALAAPACGPALGYVLHVMLALLNSPAQNTMRLHAVSTIHALLERHPQDAFVETVMPGICTGLLVSLSTLEKDPSRVSTETVRCLALLLLRGWSRAAADGKIDTILARLEGVALLAVQIGREAELVALGTLLAELLLAKAGSEDALVLLPAVRALAVVHGRQLGDPCLPLQASMPCQRLLLHALDGCLADVDECIGVAVRPADVEQRLPPKLSLLGGLLSLVDCTNWPADLAHCIVRVALHRSQAFLSRCHTLRTSLVPVEGCSWDGGLHELRSWGWEDPAAVQAARLLELVAACGRVHDLCRPLLSPTANISEQASQLLCLGRVLSSWPSTEDAPAAALFAADQLVASLDDFYCRDPSLLDAGCVSRDEDSWLMAWCAAAAGAVSRFGTQQGVCTEAQTLDYLVCPLVSLLAAHSLQVQDAARRVLAALALSNGASDLVLFLGEREESIVDQIASYLRFPSLYPRGPLVLASFIDAMGASCRIALLADLVTEMAERAADYQDSPAYVLLLLGALSRCAATASRTKTVLGADRTKGPRSKELVDTEDVEPQASLEQEVGAALMRLAVNFVADDEVRVRLAALDLLADAVAVFADDTKGSQALLLPLVHHTWRPVVSRLLDGSLEVSRRALRVIAAQSRVAGDFLRDRVQKEMLPKVDAVLAREVETVGMESSVPALLEILRNIGRADGRVVQSAVHTVLGVCGRGVSVPTAVALIKSLAEIDADQVWFVLLGQLSTEHYTINPPEGTPFPPIDLVPFKKALQAQTASQAKAIRLALGTLCP